MSGHSNGEVLNGSNLPVALVHVNRDERLDRANRRSSESLTWVRIAGEADNMVANVDVSIRATSGKAS